MLGRISGFGFYAVRWDIHYPSLFEILSLALQANRHIIQFDHWSRITFSLLPYELWKNYLHNLTIR
jgi:hypothetical protein